MVYTFYENQKSCALDIVNNFDIIPYVILLAMMQSGKTGTYLYASLMMLHKGLVDNIIIVCGVSDKKLRKQCNDDTGGAILSFCIELISGTEGIRLYDEYKNKVKVLFSQDIKSGENISDRTLIVWDESHYAQSKNNKPYKWFTKNNIEKAFSGDFDNITSRGIKILSVSATPFSETIDNTYSLSKKAIVFLTPAPTYRGIFTFIENNAVYTSFMINENNKGKLHDIMVKFQMTSKYLMFRVKDSHILEGMSKVLNYDFVKYDMENDFDLNERYLSNSPENTTVISVKGMCRLGCVIHKKNIGMVFESSNDSKSDATLQSLWGRICGTPSPSDDFAATEIPLVFVTEDNLVRAKEYSDAFQNKTIPIIDHASNVKKCRKKNKNKSNPSDYKHPSIPIKLSDHELFNISKERDLKWMIDIPSGDSFWNGNNSIQIDELKELIKNKDSVSKRNMESKSYKGRFNKMLESLINKSRENFHFYAPTEKDTNKLIMMVYKEDYYFMWWTKNQSEEIINIAQRESLPKTTGKEAFSVHNETNDEVFCNGGQTYHLPQETSINCDLMKCEIIKCIKRSKEDGFEPSVCSQYDNKSKDHKGINLDLIAWGFNKNKKSLKLEKMINDIKIEYGVNVTFVKVKGRPPSGTESMSRYSKITW